MKKYGLRVGIIIALTLIAGASAMAYAAGKQYYFTPRGTETFVFEMRREEAIAAWIFM